VSETAEELFLMTNLYPRRTGLPMVIWVGPSYGARHAPRIKVMQAHGTQMDPNNLAVVRVRPTPEVIVGHLSAEDQAKVFQWIALNEQVIMDHWNGLTDGGDVSEQRRRLP
jgi:hypothetical protein